MAEDKKTGFASRQITDRASFDAATSEPHELAALYAYKQLDGLIELARFVSHDFFARPQLYTRLDDFGVATKLARLRTRYGSDEDFLSLQQRDAIYTPLFGSQQPGVPGDFARTRDDLLEAAKAFAEWSQATGIPALRARVRTMHLPFKIYLERQAGASVAWSRKTGLPAVADEVAYPVLRDRGVILVFGLGQPPDDAWPYREDANGEKLVEAICGWLDPDVARPWTPQGFGAQQRAALRGAEAIAAVLDFEMGASDEDLDVMITRCYTWYAALGACTVPDTVAGAGTDTPL